jgi:hypothetical protein
VSVVRIPHERRIFLSRSIEPTSFTILLLRNSPPWVYVTILVKHETSEREQRCERKKQLGVGDESQLFQRALARNKDTWEYLEGSEVRHTRNAPLALAYGHSVSSSLVVPDFENIMSKSSVVTRPMSPCSASTGASHNARVPVDTSVWFICAPSRRSPVSAQVYAIHTGIHGRPRRWLLWDALSMVARIDGRLSSHKASALADYHGTEWSRPIVSLH